MATSRLLCVRRRDAPPCCCGRAPLGRIVPGTSIGFRVRKADSPYVPTASELEPAFLYTLFRGRGPAKLTQISGAKYFYRKQTIEGPFSKLETATAMAAVVQANPFLKEAGIDESKLHVTFLSDAAPATAEKMLAVLAAKRSEEHTSELQSLV